MHLAATWNQAQAASFLSAIEVEQQLRWEFIKGTVHVEPVTTDGGSCARTDWSKPMFFQSMKHRKSVFFVFFATLSLYHKANEDA